MLMIPITFLPATGLVLLALWLATRLSQQLRAPWMNVFLASLALQLALLGARYGYGVEAVLKIQHLSGVCIPPLGLLAFGNPAITPRLALHGLPVIAMGVVLSVAPFLADALLACVTLGYAGGLLFVLRRDRDELFSWAPMRFTATLRLGLYAAVATLGLSGLTDAVITVDFMTTGGIRIRAIAAVASLVGLGMLAVWVLVLLRHDLSRPSGASSDADAALVQRLTAEIMEKQLFRDPDLTLSRLARRLALPAREISQAVNKSTGLNMSQFINNMRVSAVCDMLGSTDMPITTAMLEAGFYTKSNFNREFRRVTGQTPTQWRNSSVQK